MLLKRTLQILGFVIAFIVITVLAVVLAFDPNYYRPQVEKLVKEKTGRPFKIAGKIGWILWPEFAVTLPRITLANAPGFPEQPMIEAEKVQVAVAWRPLLSKRLEIGNIMIDGVVLRYQRRADGSNLDDLRQPPAPAAPDPKAKPPKAPLPPVAYQVAGLRLRQLTVEISDLDSGVARQLLLEKLTVGTFAPGRLAPVVFDGRLREGSREISIKGEGKLLVAEAFASFHLKPLALQLNMVGDDAPPLSMTASSHISLLPEQRQLQLDKLEANINATLVSGQATLTLDERLKVQADLHSPQLDLNPYLPAATPQAEPQPAPQPATEASAQALQATEAAPLPEPGSDITAAQAPAAVSDDSAEPDLAWLQQLDGRVDLSIDQLKARQLLIEDLHVSLAVAKGELALSPVTADLYGGSFNGSLAVSHRGVGKANSYQLYATLRGVDGGALWSAWSGQRPFDGKADVEFRLDGQGLSLAQMRQGMNGRGNLELREGAIYGLGIVQQIREAGALMMATEAAPATAASTPFSALTASWQLANGKVNNNSLQLMSPLLRVSGAGHISLPQQTLDYRLGVSVNTTADVQGLEALRGLTVPLMIRGPWAEPQIQFDLAKALASKPVTELERGLNKLKEKLKTD